MKVCNVTIFSVLPANQQTEKCLHLVMFEIYHVNIESTLLSNKKSGCLDFLHAIMLNGKKVSKQIKAMYYLKPVLKNDPFLS